MHCCKQHGVVVIVLSFQPSYPGSIRTGFAIAWTGTILSKGMDGWDNKHGAFFFGFKALHYS